MKKNKKKIAVIKIILIEKKVESTNKIKTLLNIISFIVTLISITVTVYSITN